MNQRLKDLYVHVSVHATADREHEAAIELLMLVMMAEVRSALATHNVEALLDDIDSRVASTVLRSALFSAARDVAGADHEVDADEESLLGQIAARFD